VAKVGEHSGKDQKVRESEQPGRAHSGERLDCCSEFAITLRMRLSSNWGRWENMAAL
jgi:hypothetical protein